MVEAAGVEPSRRTSVNRLMAHDFRSLVPDSLPLLAVFLFPSLLQSPPFDPSRGDIGETDPHPPDSCSRPDHTSVR
jgi:hypothetical protein